MAAQLHLAAPFKSQIQLQQTKNFNSSAFYYNKFPRVRCSAATTPTKKSYNITLLPGDGIGPEIISISKHVLQLAASIEGSPFFFFLNKENINNV